MARRSTTIPQPQKIQKLVITMTTTQRVKIQILHLQKNSDQNTLLNKKSATHVENELNSSDVLTIKKR